jgi:F420-0:gamma-glutamyl ligase-like protein
MDVRVTMLESINRSVLKLLRFALKLGSTDGVDLQNKPVSFSSLVPSKKLRGEKTILLGQHPLD